jgi:hypothetical protein
MATAIFLLSLLGYRDRLRANVMRVGIAFTGGVFVAYTVGGLGLLRLVSSFSGVTWLSAALYGGCGLMLLFLAYLSAGDVVKARAGSFRDISLQLSRSRKRQIHALLRGRITGATGALPCFAIGAVVAALEFGCTGQVYLPTIMYAAKATGWRGLGLAYLLLYNVIFVAPLILIFLVGRSSIDAIGRLQASFRRFMPAVKGLTALLFALLSSYMLYQAYMFVRYGALG